MEGGQRGHAPQRRQRLRSPVPAVTGRRDTVLLLGAAGGILLLSMPLLTSLPVSSSSSSPSSLVQPLTRPSELPPTAPAAAAARAAQPPYCSRRKPGVSTSLDPENHATRMARHCPFPGLGGGAHPRHTQDSCQNETASSSCEPECRRWYSAFRRRRSARLILHAAGMYLRLRRVGLNHANQHSEDSNARRIATPD